MAPEQGGEAPVHQDVSPGRDAYFAGRDQHMHQTQVTFQVQAGSRVGRVDTSRRRLFSRYRDTYLRALLAACDSASGAQGAGARLSRVEHASTANVSSIRAPLPDVVADKPSLDGEAILELLTRSSRQSRVLVLGGLGMGKTTQAQSVVRTLAHIRRRGATLPVHVRIDAEAVELIKVVGSLPELARRTTPAMVAQEPPGWLEDQLARGRCTVVVDDTPEVAEQDRSGISRWLRKQFASYPGTSFLVTSGPSGEGELRPGCTECLEILPLTVDQVENWQENADITFRSWLRMVPGLWVFAGNPRLLEVMIRCDAESRASDGRGPRRSDFLAAVCGVLLTGTRQAIPDITAEACQAVLGELAHHVCVKRDLRASAEDAARTASKALAAFGCDVTAGDFVRVLAVPAAVHGTSRLNRWLARTLLGPAPGQERLRSLQRANRILTADTVARLRAIERDLHDSTQAELVAIAITLSLAADELGETPGPGAGRLADLITRARGQTDNAITNLRRITHGINPPALDAGLATALPGLTAGSKARTSLTMRLKERPSPVIERAVYFCVAELLTNVAKHSSATSCAIDVRLVDGRFRVTVSDDGKGGAQVGGDGGLAGLEARVAAVAGTLSIRSPAGGPTIVTIDLPSTA